MKLAGRSRIAVILAVIYTLIIMSPLAARLLNSPTVAHALTGECTGDCRTCGCPAESVAAGTCCCMKKQHHSQGHGNDHDPISGLDQKAVDSIPQVIASCGCPCEGGEHVTLSCTGDSELLPCYFTAQFSIPCTSTRFPILTGSVTSFRSAPPDPPPKISFGA